MKHRNIILVRDGPFNTTATTTATTTTATTTKTTTIMFFT
jgi:hypothetical protein